MHARTRVPSIGLTPKVFCLGEFVAMRLIEHQRCFAFTINKSIRQATDLSGHSKAGITAMECLSKMGPALRLLSITAASTPKEQSSLRCVVPIKQLHTRM